MPTGSGKTAVELALPHIFAARRTLVLVPTVLLRDQAADAFEMQDVLRRIQAINDSANPKVLAISGGGVALHDIQSADVVIAIPQTFAGYLDGESPLPAELFDLVLVDEAHHAPAATWEQVLRHFLPARTFLFTATPRRRDRQEIPGKRIYHYSVRNAIANEIFNPIEPRVLVSAGNKDSVIIDAVLAASQEPGREHVPVLARVSTIARAEALAQMYTTAGLQATTYHSRLLKSVRQRRLIDWKTGEFRVLVGVDALGEGIDFPDLRILAYHDKHKSESATMQQVGRLARKSVRFPGSSLLITQAGGEEYPALTGALLSLYHEDSDWAVLLPGLIDTHIEEIERVHEYADSFAGQSRDIELETIRPLGVVELREPRRSATFEPDFFSDGRIPLDLSVGTEIAGHRVAMARLSRDRRSLYLCFTAWATPKWSTDEKLNALQSHLCILTWHPDPSDVHAPVLAISATDNRIKNRVLELIDETRSLTLVDVGKLQKVVDSLPRKSVSNVGVRSTSGLQTGVAQYVNYSGRGVDRGLGDATMGQKALGHAMLQITGDGVSINAGIAVEKGKYWELRHLTLVQYWEWITWLVSQYWDPRESQRQRLLPALARGATVTDFPIMDVLYAEMDPGILDGGWRLVDDERLLGDLWVEAEVSTERLLLRVVDRDSGELIWRGSQQPGSPTVYSDESLLVTRGGSGRSEVSEVLTACSPSLWFRDGSMIRGGVRYDRTRGSSLSGVDFVEAWDWAGIDITNETGLRRGTPSTSIHGKVAAYLINKYRGVSRTWIFSNDGSREIADHIVIHLQHDDTPIVELWHSKAASGELPGLSEKHFELLGQQGMKSRRWVVEGGLWTTLATRLDGAKPDGPRLIHLGGGVLDDFRAIVGIAPRAGLPNLAELPPATRGVVVLIQPGLSRSALEGELRKAEHGKHQALIDVLSLTQGVVQDVATFRVIGSR